MSQFLYHSGSGFPSLLLVNSSRGTKSDEFPGSFSVGPKLSITSTNRSEPDSDYNSKDGRDEEDEYLLVYDFVSVLQAAQLCGLDLLPISRQEGLGSLGDGGTANLKQSYLNVQLSFAFKNINSAVFLAMGPSGETKMFKALVSEILALSHPVMRRHPNIVKILGVSWEIDLSSHRTRVWPVLVFQKTEYGDLFDFINTEDGRNLPFSERLDFCIAIGSALCTTHACRVVHGDIKPSNILVFKDDDGKFYPKLSDYGYSTLVPYTNSFVKLAISAPWNAPEYHGREFPFSEAKKTDIYSFGLLCLWLLLKEHLKKSGIGFGSSEVQELEGLKKRGKIVEKVQELLLETGLSQDIQLGLTHFLTRTLEKDPSKRAECIADVLHILRNLSISSSELVAVGADEHKLVASLPKIARTKFELPRYILQLVQADFRVREYIFESLEKRAKAKNEKSTAFQVAFCYYTGFGVAANHTKVLEWLEKSGKTHKSLEFVVQEVSVQVQHPRVDGEPSLYLDTLLEEMLKEGYLYRTQYDIAYNGIPDVEAKYEREIRDMENALGSEATNIVTLTLRHILALVLYKRGEFRKAQEIFEVTVNAIGTTAAGSVSTLLALSLQYQGEFSKAEKIQRELVANPAKGTFHPETITNLNNLATTLYKENRLEECEILYLRTLELVRKNSRLGEEHPNVLTIKGNLALVYIQQGRFVEAERLTLETLEARRRVLGEDHRETIENHANLSILYWTQGLREQALEIFEKVTTESRRLWGPRDQTTAQLSSQLAAYYFKLKRYSDVEEALRDYVEAFNRGETDLFVLERIIFVAEALIQLENHSLAQQYLSAIASKLPKIDHKTPITETTTLEAASLLSRVYDGQKQWTKVIKLQPQIIAYYQKVYGERSEQFFRFTELLVSALYHVGRLQEAEKLISERITLLQSFRETTNSTTTSLGVFSSRALTLFALLLDIHIGAGKFQNAREVNERIIELRSVKFGKHHPEVFDARATGANLYEQEGLIEEAKSLYSEILEDARQILGNDHYETLLLMLGLARTYRGLEDWTASEKLCREVVDGLEKSRSSALLSQSLNKHPNKRPKEQKGSASDPEDEVYIQALSDLAASLFYQGRAEDAEPLQVATLRLSKESIGLEHTLTLIAMLNLSTTYKERKMWPEYEQLVLEYLNVQKPTYFLKLRIVPVVIAKLMGHYEGQCRWQSVIDLYDDSVPHFREEIQRKPLWPVSLQMCVLRSLAEQEKWKDLDARIEQFVLEDEKSHNKRPMVTLQHQKMQLLSRVKQGKLSDANEVCWKCIEMYQSGLIDRDLLEPECLEVVDELILALLVAGRIAEALPIQRQLLQISDKLYPKYLITVNRRELLALSLKRNLYPVDGSEPSDNKDDSLAEVEAAFTTAIEDRKQMGLLGKPETWGTMKELAEYYILVGRYPDALAILVERAKAVSTAEGETKEGPAYEEEVSQAIITVSNAVLKMVHSEEQAKREKCIALFQLVADTSMRELGKDHPTTVSSVVNVELIKLQVS